MKKALIPMLIVLASCAGTGKRFGKLYPGMTRAQVNETMEKGPSDVKQFDDTYTAWFYGEDRCILLKGDEVLTKSSAKEKEKFNLLGLAGMKEKKPAECLPPGAASQAKKQRTIDTPFGTVTH